MNQPVLLCFETSARHANVRRSFSSCSFACSAFSGLSPAIRALLFCGFLAAVGSIGRAQSCLSLYYAIPEPASTNWTSYSIPLVETAGWTVGDPGGPSPTQAQFQNLLHRLTGLAIRFDVTAQLFLDNVSLAGLVSSTFPACATDGWILGDKLSMGCNSLIGNPPGSINNGAVLAVFDAPAKFLADQGAAYGGNLTFDVRGNAGFGPGAYVVLTAAQDPAAAQPGTILAWGDDYSGQSGFPASVTNVLAISAGKYSSLALRSDGTVATCGWNPTSDSQFGLSTSQLNSSQTNIPSDLTNVISVASGAYHFLALRANETVTVWGNNSFEQTNLPPGLTNIVALAGGGLHGLALNSAGRVFAWGVTNTGGEGGGPNYGQTTVPSGLSNVVAVAAGSFFSLALRNDGSVVAWGRNEAGQTNVPSGLTGVLALAAGSSHALALRGDGTVTAWGLNTSGQTNVPASLTNAVAIAAGGFFSMALRADGTVVAWGDNTFVQTNVPAGLSNVLALATGGYHSLSLLGSAPPVLRAPFETFAMTPDGFAVSLPSQSGKVYALEYKNSLSDPSWVPLPLVPGNGGLLTIVDRSGVGSQRFFRVRRW